MNKEIEDFIKHFKGSKQTFLFGCCYWFAYILHQRFGLEIVYEPVEGHFMAGELLNTDSARMLFDIRGDVTDKYISNRLYRIDWLMANEPKWYAHLMRDCRDFISIPYDDMEAC